MLAQLENDQIYIKSLELLYQACEPLIYDICYLYQEERDRIIKEIIENINIKINIIYSARVKQIINRGDKPPTWEEFQQRQLEFEKELNES